MWRHGARMSPPTTAVERAECTEIVRFGSTDSADYRRPNQPTGPSSNSSLGARTSQVATRHVYDLRQVSDLSTTPVGCTRARHAPSTSGGLARHHLRRVGLIYDDRCPHALGGRISRATLRAAAGEPVDNPAFEAVPELTHTSRGGRVGE